MQPGIPVHALDRYHGTLFFAWPVHLAQDRVRQRRLRDHGVAGQDFASLPINPFIPQAGQCPRLAICAGESPPDVSASTPVWFISRRGRDQAAARLLPGVAECGSRGNGLASGVVGGQRSAVSRRRGTLFGEGRDDAPDADHAFALASNERAKVTRSDEGLVGRGRCGHLESTSDLPIGRWGVQIAHISCVRKEA